MRLNTFTCSEFSLIYKKIISYPNKRNNTANLDINWLITNFLQLFMFFKVKSFFFVK
jgi:hypothetical protein